MLDLLLLVVLLGALYGGYRRGFLAGAISLATVVAATLIGYRAGVPGGSLLRSWTGSGPLSSRWIASLVVFVAVLMAGVFVGRRWGAAPSRIRTADRIAGVITSGACYALTVALVLLLAGATPNLPAGLHRLLTGSQAAGLANGASDSIATVTGWVLGDPLLELYVTGGHAAETNPAGIEDNQKAALPSVPPSSLVDRPDSAQSLYQRLNATRTRNGVEVLSWSGPLATIAAGIGMQMYQEGLSLACLSPCRTLDDRLRAAGIPYQAAGQTLAFSLTLGAVHQGLLASPSDRAMMLDSRFGQVGVSVLEGPFGFMVVHLFLGENQDA